MGLLDVIARVTRAEDSVHLELEDDCSPTPGITVDDALSTVSTNPVQNKVITTAILEEMTVINDLRENKQDYSPFIRKIYIGTDATPSQSLGSNGDLYIYLPN